MHNTKISVCIASFNGEDYIEEQLKSILGQLTSSDEIIISDDSSDDNTIRIINSLNDNRIKLLKNQKFKNPIFNFENALKKASGEYIFLADQDDVWHEDKVKKTLSMLDKYDLILHDCWITNKNLNSLGKSMFQSRNSQRGLIRNIVKNSYMGCCMAFKRNVLEKSLPFPKHIPMHDQWIGLIGEKYFNVIFSDQKLLFYRRHDFNASPTSSKSTNSILKKLFFRVAIFYALSKRILFDV
ncbi:MAG: glycosyltransferase involved in cell wall biosynthesis [Psychroserpens sp.]|jgi:glycosyltransferase involved in cell wall biosynthesis